LAQGRKTTVCGFDEPAVIRDPLRYIRLGSIGSYSNAVEKGGGGSREVRMGKNTNESSASYTAMHVRVRAGEPNREAIRGS